MKDFFYTIIIDTQKYLNTPKCRSSDKSEEDHYIRLPRCRKVAREISLNLFFSMVPRDTLRYVDTQSQAKMRGWRSRRNVELSFFGFDDLFSHR